LGRRGGSGERFTAAPDGSRRFLNQNRAGIVAFQCPSQGWLQGWLQGSLAETLQAGTNVDPAMLIMTAL
jgi:hypothetical protein